MLDRSRDQILVVNRDAEVDRVGSGLLHEREEHRAVRVTDLARRERSGRDELVTR